MMQWLFYASAVIVIVASLLVVTSKHAVHAVLYLVVSLLALSLCFYLLGAPFAAALQIIVYAGAILVLFVFAVMLFNISQEDVRREAQWLSWQAWAGPTILVLLLLAQWVLFIQMTPESVIRETLVVEARVVGARLFGPYLLAVEIASFLLLAGLVGGYHLAKKLPEGNQ
jgi:NADH-quinone oxidoreductase subunit J